MEEQIDTIHSTKKIVIISSIAVVVVVGIMLLIVFFPKKDTTDVSLPTRQDNTVEQGVGASVDPMPNDIDRDGIENIKEEELGLSVVNPDTDGDGLFDNDEIVKWKSDPLKFDTDGDGYGDGWEVLKGYKPVGEGLIGE